MTNVHVVSHAEIFTVDPAEPVRPNGIVSHSIYKQLVASLNLHGWDGPPLVLLLRDECEPPTRPLAVTGSHRLAAAEQAGVEAPCVDLADLFAERGLDLEALMDAWLPEGISITDDAFYRTIARLLGNLPIWMVRGYDIDLFFCEGAADGGGHDHPHQCAHGDREHVLDDQPHVCVLCGEEFAAQWTYSPY